MMLPFGIHSVLKIFTALADAPQQRHPARAGYPAHVALLENFLLCGRSVTAEHVSSHSHAGVADKVHSKNLQKRWKCNSQEISISAFLGR